MIEALNHLEVITLFVDDMPLARAFYRDVFGVKIVFEDEVSVVVKLDSLLINLLCVSEAAELVAPVNVGAREAGARLLLTIKVDDVHAVSARLREHGVELLNGPWDRPWGRRTAAFADPSGHVWEIAQELARK
jgi:catechol 2,3-dioxygenase-like lactoylglutathione lyase family enzyme